MVELTIVAPALVLLLVFMVWAGRVVQAQNDVYSAATNAARAASNRQSAASAARDARAVVSGTLGSERLTCSPLTITSSVADLRPGGTVAVGVRCGVVLDGLTGFGLRAPVLSARAVETIDRYRSSPPDR